MPRTIHLTTSGTQCISAWLVEPTTAPKGGIVIVQEIFGVNQHIRDLAQRFADNGYVAIAPAFFDHVETGVELEYDRSGFARGRHLASEISMDDAVADIASAAESIASAGRIGCVGYCWGGTIALLAATRLGLPSASFYGSRNVQYLDEETDAPLQFHFGKQDSSIPPEAVERHRVEFPDADIFVYPAGHGFNCTMRKDYDAESSELAWSRVLAFFDNHLGSYA